MSSERLTGTVTVALPPERAFEFFTASMSKWWPKEYHIGSAEMAETVLEPKEGGRWYERCVDGSECDWGVVLAWEPPHRVVVTWQINGYWQFDDDAGHASEVEITFTAAETPPGSLGTGGRQGPAETVVAIEHRYIERLVASEHILGALHSGGGWGAMLSTYAAAAGGRATQPAGRAAG